jgi:uncharacterized membrane protein
VTSPWKTRAIVFSLAGVAALLAAFLAPAWIRGTVRIVAEYDAAAAALLIGLFIFVFRDNEAETQTRAAINDPGRNVVLTIIILSIAAGFAAAIAILGKGPDVQTPGQRSVAVALAITAAVLGWAVTHATFAIRYAHLFYRKSDASLQALTFPKTSEPDDYDFLYFAFIIGMTFQVSDVQVNEAGMRRLVLGHGLISFAYNTAILALGVNLISNLLH